MAIYNLDAVNEQLHENEEVMEEEASILDSLEEACDYMMSMLGESTAAQRHFGSTAKDYATYANLGREMLDGSKTGKAANKISDKMTGSKLIANRAAKNVAKSFHSGKVQDRINKAFSGKSTEFMTDREKEEAKVQTMADAKGRMGYALSKYAKDSGADVKGAYDKAAAKADKKRAIKETCLHILSIIDDIDN